MKTSWNKLSTIVLIIAVGVLYFLQFSEEKNTQEKTKSESQEYFQQPSNSTLKIAYVNSDTVSKHYLFAEKIQTALLAKRSSAENQRFIARTPRENDGARGRSRLQQDRGSQGQRGSWFPRHTGNFSAHGAGQPV